MAARLSGELELVHSNHDLLSVNSANVLVRLPAANGMNAALFCHSTRPVCQKNRQVM
jgi:hypothetical protein